MLQHVRIQYFYADHVLIVLLSFYYCVKWIDFLFVSFYLYVMNIIE